MSVTGRVSPRFGVVLLVLTITVSCTHASAGEQQSNKATARLKVLSESQGAPDVAEIRRLINAGADVNLRNKFGVTPLFVASQNGHAEVVKLLLAGKADVNVTISITGKDYTALRVAKMMGHARVVKLLKEHGAKD